MFAIVFMSSVSQLVPLSKLTKRLAKIIPDFYKKKVTYLYHIAQIDTTGLTKEQLVQAVGFDFMDFDLKIVRELVVAFKETLHGNTKYFHTTHHQGGNRDCILHDTDIPRLYKFFGMGPVPSFFSTAAQILSKTGGGGEKSKAKSKSASASDGPPKPQIPPGKCFPFFFHKDEKYTFEDAMVPGPQAGEFRRIVQKIELAVKGAEAEQESAISG